MLAIYAVLFLAAVVTKTGASFQGRLVCPVNSQRLISGDTTLLNPATSISSSSEASGSNPARDFINPSRGWCTAEDTFDVSGEYVELNFTEPVVATILVSGGKQRAFVMNFSVFYSESAEDSTLQSYGVLRPVQDFNVQSITISDAYLALEVPFLAERMKFVVNDGIKDPFNRTCWSMRIYGCRASEAQMIVEEEPVTIPQDSTSSSTSTSTVQEQPTTAASTELPSVINCPVQASFAQRDLLLVVVPSAVVLIVVVLIAVTSGIIICLCISRTPQGESPTYESVKVKIMNKRAKNLVDGGVTSPGLYDQPRPQFYDVPKASLPSPSRSSTSSIGSNMEVKNPVYLEKKNLQEMSMALKQLPPDEGNDYEDVLEAMPKKRGAERQTQANTCYSSNMYPSPPEIPNNDNVRPPLPDPSIATRTMSLDNTAVPKYSRIVKEGRTGGDGGSARGRSASPVIKSHYMSTNAAITEELNRLTTELENSLRGQS